MPKKSLNTGLIGAFSFVPRGLARLTLRLLLSQGERNNNIGPAASQFVSLANVCNLSERKELARFTIKSYQRSSCRVYYQPHVETEMLEDTLDVLEMLEVQSADVGEHRHVDVLVVVVNAFNITYDKVTISLLMEGREAGRISTAARENGKIHFLG